jgi:hypothetical protein
MTWTEKHCRLLCREILAINPFTGTRKGSVQRGANWKLVADNLMAIEKPKFKVDTRAVREKYASLAGKLRNKLKEEEKESGIDPEMSEVEEALEEIMELEEEAERVQKQGTDEKKKNNDADRATAENMRKRAMQTLGESSSKKGVDDEETETKKKKRRYNGSDTLMFLREKNEMQQDVKKQEVELRKKEIELQEKKHDDFLQMMMAQQQQHTKQMQDFQAMMVAIMARVAQK